MTKENWVGGQNTRFGRTTDEAGEKYMADSMRWGKKIGE
jgi:hypothetical protein